ncbi:MAG TPA: 23S rRNA (guanosine(2251)-2'-O)-methyltransferase RlmB [Ignavibacteriaceae bacterium]|nr:23S rRNA (guanosine(2251)-2'-O)-methyltransferase RlmB [Ignavibacteriaceae bacterium]
MSLILGRKPVLEAINSGEELEQIYILFGQKGGIVDAIRVAAKKRGIKVNQITPEKFKALTDHPNPQGIIARKSSHKFYEIEKIISSSKIKQYPLLLILDSIQDTHNLGAIFRSAECSDVDGVIITKYNSAPVNETVVKTSAGAIEYLKIAQVNNLAQTIKLLKDNGFWIIGSSLESSKPYTEIDYKIPLALILGNEEKGIRRLTAENCDFLVNIPMKGKIQSLNVSVAAGIILFEILHQRNSIR